MRKLFIVFDLSVIIAAHILYAGVFLSYTNEQAAYPFRYSFFLLPGCKKNALAAIIFNNNWE
jgi:hypothetical protein